ncbi:uncharacterized protein LOC143722883 [Siphateles boraxobius]|uniref:uncharacterized protein LOC143722883 n=1 Tax=Siphateles boraxobius TaxID=180520 RepID=UPI0040646D3B
MKEQFQKVRERLEVVSEEVQQINQEIKKSGIDATYFSVEENLTNQFRKLISKQKKLMMMPMAELFFETIPLCVVHTVKTSCKDLGFSSSFSDELHFFEEFKNFYVFLHSA